MQNLIGIDVCCLSIFLFFNEVLVLMNKFEILMFGRGNIFFIFYLLFITYIIVVYVIIIVVVIYNKNKNNNNYFFEH